MKTAIAMLILANGLFLSYGRELTMILEKDPPASGLGQPYRTPEAGLRYITNTSAPEGAARFRIDKADEQSIGATTPRPDGGFEFRQPVGGPFSWTRNAVLVEMQPIKLINDGGMTFNGKQCDVMGACDPVCYINVDFLKPNDPFPGGAGSFIKIKELNDVNSPALDVVFTAHYCAALYRAANVRLYCEDSDGFSQADLINRWSCPISQQPAADQASSQWSSPAECLPVYQAGKIRMTYKYKVYYGSESLCARQAATTSRKPYDSPRFPPVTQPGTPQHRGPSAVIQPFNPVDIVQTSPTQTTRDPRFDAVIQSDPGRPAKSRVPPFVAAIAPSTSRQPRGPPLAAAIEPSTTRMPRGPPIAAAIEPSSTRRPRGPALVATIEPSSTRPRGPPIAAIIEATSTQRPRGPPLAATIQPSSTRHPRGPPVVANIEPSSTRRPRGPPIAAVIHPNFQQRSLK